VNTYDTIPPAAVSALVQMRMNLVSVFAGFFAAVVVLVSPILFIPWIPFCPARFC
jgi:hypothetical protein